jgi:hypothetical protein
MTVDWYRAWAANTDMRTFTQQQVNAYRGITDQDAIALGAAIH